MTLHAHGRRSLALQAGVSLIELMVALVIGLFLILGAVTVYTQSRSTYRALDATSRVQEKARYAMAVLETDIRMANFWGLNSRADYITVDRDAVPPEDNLQALDAVGAVIDDCGNDWAIDLRDYVGGSNGDYDALSGCAPSLGDAVAGTDVLLIRRAGSERLTAANSLRADGLYIQTGRVKGTVFSTAKTCSPLDQACIPGDYLPPLSETHDLVVLGYFVSSASTGDATQPSLRRKRLLNGDAGARIVEEELLNGVEDLQVQFGVDTDATPDGNADLFVNPEDPVLANRSVIAVRLWLRVRSDEPDFSFLDANAYQYADMAKPAAISDADRRFRRVVVERTIQLRNTRGYDQT
jgi:type IV pilus assembly protein PilW